MIEEGSSQADPRYLDVWVPAGLRKSLPVETNRHAFVYVFEGAGAFRAASQSFGVLTERRRSFGNRPETVRWFCSTAAKR